jgi:hypothetical protein
MDAARDAERDLEGLLDEIRRLQDQRARELVQELAKESHALGDRLRSEFADVLAASDDGDTERQIVQNLK